MELRRSLALASSLPATWILFGMVSHSTKPYLLACPVDVQHMSHDQNALTKALHTDHMGSLLSMGNLPHAEGRLDGNTAITPSVALNPSKVRLKYRSIQHPSRPRQVRRVLREATAEGAMVGGRPARVITGGELPRNYLTEVLCTCLLPYRPHMVSQNIPNPLGIMVLSIHGVMHDFCHEQYNACLDSPLLKLALTGLRVLRGCWYHNEE